jgi:hypothetical protein
MPASELFSQEISPAATCPFRQAAFYFHAQFFPARGATMIWRFEVEAAAQERLLSRILLVLDQQRVTIRSFAGKIDIAEARVTFEVASDQDKAYRIEALLHRLEAVHSVDVSQLAKP